MPQYDGIELVKLVCNNEFKPRWESYTLGELDPECVRVKNELTAAKHGTEKGEILGTASYMNFPMHGTAFDRSKATPFDATKWQDTGNTSVGTVIAVGKEVKHLKEGDRVYNPGRFQTVADFHNAKKLDGISPEAACCMDPADFAIAAVRDAKICIGDNVIIFGMGAIGLFTVQFAKLQGALNVVAVDPIPARRELALQHGATKVVDPKEVADFGVAAREWFENGADVTIEASGNYIALNQCLQATCYRGKVVPLSFYLGDAKGVYLGEEFHFNLLNIISARACSDPQRELYWNEQRFFQTLRTLYKQGTIKPYGLPSPITTMDKLPEAYGKIYHAPNEVVKVAVKY
jgi:threonine dehydrogenase-like Zn-dependent dehydrogenase